MVNELKHFKVDNREILLRKVITPKHIAKYARQLTNVQKDTAMIVTGYPGEGKSVLAREIAKHFDKKYNDERNCIYSRKEFMSKVENFPPSAFVLDEAINLLYKRDWNTGAQKELVKILNICRSKKHLLIFVQPEFNDLDKDIRNSRIRLWVYAIKRGVAAAFKPERSIGGGEDPWNIAENNKIVKGFVNKFGQTIGTIEGAFRTKNFLTYLRWSDISKEEYNVYEEVKDTKKYEDLGDNKTFTPEQMKREAMKQIFDVYALLESQGKVKLGAKGLIASYLQVSDGTAGSYIRKSRIALGLLKDKPKEESELEVSDDEIIQI
jgi:hypothetical protein